MRKVTLYVGSQKEGAIVQEIEVPHFERMPEVIVWGLRAFQRVEDDRYREVFLYFVPPHVWGLPVAARDVNDCG